jgi:ABC-type dipeptide/oligopeptide/nickel transport system permease component/outer membrane protein assembly factor BamB
VPVGRLLPLLIVALFVAVALPALPAAHAAPSTSPPAAAPVHAAVASPPPEEWPTFRGGPERTGFTDASGPRTGAVAWIHLLPNSSQVHVRTSPVVNGSTVYVLDDLGDAYALNATRNGSEIWGSAVGPIPTAPTLSGGRLYVGDGYGDVSAIEAANGTVAWTRHVGAPVSQSLLVENSTIVAATLGGGLVALSPSGVPRWSDTFADGFYGAPAFDGSALYIASENGTVLSVSPATGAVRWSTALGATVRTGVVATGGEVYVATLSGRLYALDAESGAEQWNATTQGYLGSGSVESPPAVDATTLYLTTDGGGFFAFWRDNGSLRWNTTTAPPYSTGYAVTAAPVVTPYALFGVDALSQLDALDPANGAFRWSSPIGTTVYSSPAVAGGGLAIGTDDGTVLFFGALNAQPYFEVNGTVSAENGTPLAGASVIVSDGGPNATTDADGRFQLALPNGSYRLEVSLPAYVPLLYPFTVLGPTSLAVLLRPVPLYPLTGTVLDAGSLRPVAGLAVHLYSSLWGVRASAVSGPGGRFQLEAPNGSVYVTVDGGNGYAGLQSSLFVPDGGLSNVELLVAPLALTAAPTTWPSGAWAVAVPLLALAAGGISMLYWGAATARRKAGLSGQVLSPFGRWVVMRGAITAVQAVLLLTLLYVFGNFLKAAAPPGLGCPSGGVSELWAPSCYAHYFFPNWAAFLGNMLSGNWGTASFGHLQEPVWTFLQWWLPPSIELALFALAISVFLAYPVGLLAGWRPDGGFDTGVRGLSIVALLVPTFLLVLGLLGIAYLPFLHTLGDTPYGTLPELHWWDSHGGNPPSWIGPGSNTLPTGFPLIDGLIHGDWAFELVVLVKTLFQAFLIAVVYVAIFLRYARHAVVERASSMPILAARARGVPEPTLLWRHTGREVLPVYVLVFGITLPIYIGTQAVAEALFNDTGIGRVLISQITFLPQNGVGLTSSAVSASGNLYQVTIFLLLLVVLVVSLGSDILAHYLDPRLASEGRGA